jgi:hypothetical protein
MAGMDGKKILVAILSATAAIWVSNALLGNFFDTVISAFNLAGDLAVVAFDVMVAIVVIAVMKLQEMATDVEVVTLEKDRRQ